MEKSRYKTEPEFRERIKILADLEFVLIIDVTDKFDRLMERFDLDLNIAIKFQRPDLLIPILQ